MGDRLTQRQLGEMGPAALRRLIQERGPSLSLVRPYALRVVLKAIKKVAPELLTDFDRSTIPRPGQATFARIYAVLMGHSGPGRRPGVRAARTEAMVQALEEECFQFPAQKAHGQQRAALIRVVERLRAAGFSDYWSSAVPDSPGGDAAAAGGKRLRGEPKTRPELERFINAVRQRHFQMKIEHDVYEHLVALDGDDLRRFAWNGFRALKPEARKDFARALAHRRRRPVTPSRRQGAGARRLGRRSR